MLRLGGGVIRITHYMYFDDAGDFVPTSRHLFFRRGRPPLLDDAKEMGHGIESIFMDDRREARTAGAAAPGAGEG